MTPPNDDLENPTNENEFDYLRDWPRMNEAQKEAKLNSLLSLDAICSHLELEATEVFWLMSTRKLPGWLVGGVWKFDRPQVDHWVEEMGGGAEVHRDIKAQIERHRAG